MRNRKGFRKNILYVLFLLLGLILFLKPFGNLDELWNYNFAKGISNGLRPYAEINMVQTPIASYLCAIFLKIIGDGLIVYRLVGYGLYCTILGTFYKVLKNQIQNQSIAFLTTLFVFVITIITFIYDYNYLSLFVVLVMMGLESREEPFQNGVIGIMVGMLPLVKQTTGGAIFIANVLICCYFGKQGNFAKKIRLLLSFIPGGVYLIYLMGSQILNDFFDYAVLGVGEFTHRITPLDFAEQSLVAVVFLCVFIGILLFVFYHMVIKKQYDYRKVMWVLISSIWFLTITYPLFDFAHFVLGVIPWILVGSDFYFLEPIKLKKITEKLIKVAILEITVCVCLMVFMSVKDCKLSALNNYEGIFIQESTEKHIIEVCEYIEKKNEQNMEVYIADSSAAAYRIPLNQYTKNWDLLLGGNVGTHTVEELVAIGNPIIVLVLKDEYELNRQTHREVIDYIKTNYKKIDEVQNFDVYQKEE